MPATQCLPAYDAMPGWTSSHDSKLSLDLTVPSNVLARRGAISFCSSGSDASHPRRERRGAISYDKTDKNAVYLRKLGDVRIRSHLGSPLQQRRRGCIEASEQKALQALAELQSNPCSKYKFMTLHADGRRKSKSALRLGCCGAAGDCGAPLLDDCYTVQTKCVLSRVSDWCFNVFTLDKSTNGRSLFHVTMEVFKLHGLIDYFQLDIVKLMKFATLVEEGYHSNPYHNSMHAADVTQAVHCYMMQNKLNSCLTPIEKLVALTSAVAHDLYHPGLNQAFLIATSNPLASLYKNNAVLENHHWRSAMGILRHSGIFSHFTNSLWKMVEQQMKSLILATDMTRQQEFFSRLKKHVEDVNVDLTKYEDRHFILQIALKCADISNPCRSWDICKVWSEKVCEEFFQQGDYERKLNLPITNQCDRYRCTVPKIQTGFIDFVVLPLFRLWVKFIPSQMLQEQLSNLTRNRQNWQDLAADQKRSYDSPAGGSTTPALPAAVAAISMDINDNVPMTAGLQAVAGNSSHGPLSPNVVVTDADGDSDSDDSYCSATDPDSSVVVIPPATDGVARHDDSAKHGGQVTVATAVPASLLNDELSSSSAAAAGRRHSAPGIMPKLLERLALRRDSLPCSDAMKQPTETRCILCHGRANAATRRPSAVTTSCDHLLAVNGHSVDDTDDSCHHSAIAPARPRLSSLTPNHEASRLTNYLLAQNFVIK